MKLMIFANLAGGVGKTTSSLACAVAATEYGKKVLLIDADANAALTFINGVENPRVTTKEFLSQEYPLETALIRTSERVSLLSSSSRLSSFEIEKLISQEKFCECCGGAGRVAGSPLPLVGWGGWGGVGGWLVVRHRWSVLPWVGGC